MKFSEYTQLKEAGPPPLPGQTGRPSPPPMPGQRPPMPPQQMGRPSPPPMPGQRPAPPQQAQGTPLNSRQQFMIQTINQFMGWNLSADENGYNQMGRSEGFVKLMSDPAQWNKLTQSPLGQRMLASMDAMKKKDLLTAFVTQIAR